MKGPGDRPCTHFLDAGSIAAKTIKTVMAVYQRTNEIVSLSAARRNGCGDISATMIFVDENENRNQSTSYCASSIDFHAEVSRAFHREMSHLKVMFQVSDLRQDIIALPLFPRRYGCTGFQAEAVVSGLMDVAAVCWSVKECGRHPRVPKGGRPSAEAQACGDDDACPLISFTRQMEEQCSTLCAKG
ncbi:MAG: hypothetical protein II336_19995 [Loktanella sp.]|nr:hypothetical protein [Loktanella sp.]